MWAWTIASTWDGVAVDAAERVRVVFERDADSCRVAVDAPFHGDAMPSPSPGPVDGLWNFEVVELFLLGDDDRYLEIELGPWGHYLVLSLEGPRHVVQSGVAIAYEVQREDRRWHGRARVPAHWIPKPIGAGNAYSIHGVGDARCYRALHPVPGAEPDFHRLDCFGPIGL